MTQALDAAIHAACAVGRRADDPCGWPSCGCPEDRDAVIAALRAALPAEPTPEVIDAMVEAVAGDDGSFGSMSIAAYRALRAHLLGEDA